MVAEENFHIPFDRRSSSQRPRSSSLPDPYTPLPARRLREQDQGFRNHRASDGLAATAAYNNSRNVRRSIPYGGFGDSNRPSSLLVPAGLPSENRASLDISAWTKDVADFSEKQRDAGEDPTPIPDDNHPTYPRRSYVPPPRVDRAAFPFQEEVDPTFYPYYHNDGRPVSLPPAYIDPDHEGNSAQFNSRPIVVPPPHPFHSSQHPELAIPPPSRLPPGDLHSTFLPTYNQPPQPQEEDDDIHEETGFYHRTLAKVKAFWKRITTEPPLPSPPPSEASTSRRSSFDGGQLPGFTKEDLAKLAEYDHDLFARAMQLSRRDDFPSEPADADVQGFGGPNPSHEFVFPKPGSTKKLSYKERREQMKHRIIYNKDTKEAQQRFIITLTRALLLFGSPSHRVEPQLVSTAALFSLPAQFVHSPGCVQISFGKPERNASETVLIKSDVGLDLGRIQATHSAYRAVVRDEISATEGYERINKILNQPPLYSRKTNLLLTFIQFFVLCGSSFGGSFLDMCISSILSIFVFFAQEYASDGHLSSSGADIFISGIVSFVSRALESRVSRELFCYQAISSTAVAALLPGGIMLSGVLDIASKNIYLGSCKLVTGIMTSLYLGFGLTLGSDIWLHFDSTGRDVAGKTVGRSEYFYGTLHSTNASTPMQYTPSYLTGTWMFQENNPQKDSDTTRLLSGCVRDSLAPWYVQPLPWWTLFFLLPILNIVLSMRRAQPLKSVQLPVMVLISCASVGVTKVANAKLNLSGHPDYTALLGSFVVSLLGNVYARRFGGTAFTIMLTGILLLIPTGLAEAGGLASPYTMPGQDEYTQALDLARKMLSVIIGVMSGVYLSARLVYAFGKKKNSAFVTF